MANVRHSQLTGTNLHEPKAVAAAVVGSAYRADGAGSGGWKLPGMYAYAEGYLDGNSSATTVTTLDTYYVVAGTWTQKHADGITFTTSNGKLTIATAGDYLVTATPCAIASRAAVVAGFKFAVNGSVVSPRLRRIITAAANVESLAISTLLTGLSVSDEIQLYTTLTGDGAGVNGDTITITECILSAIIRKET